MKHELTKMIYIASPYTAKSGSLADRLKLQKRRFKEVNRLIGELNDLYEYAFIGPITQSHVTAQYQKNKKTTFKYWARRDFTYISRCDELWVLLMDGWNKSTGVLEEIKFAQKHNIAVKYLDPNNLTLQYTELSDVKQNISTCS